MAIKKRPVSPRQKMINLMYVVLMAMLALNISTEVLNGFSIVEESLNRTTANSSAENAAIYGDFSDQMKQNPAKVKEWFDKEHFFVKLSPINPNNISEKNHLGNGVVEGVNLV